MIISLYHTVLLPQYHCKIKKNILRSIKESMAILSKTILINELKGPNYRIEKE